MGLNDIRQLVHLMSLTAGGRIELPSEATITVESQNICPLSKSSPLSGSLSSKGYHFLRHLSNSISSLAISNPDAANMVVNICTKVVKKFKC